MKGIHINKMNEEDKNKRWRWVVFQRSFGPVTNQYWYTEKEIKQIYGDLVLGRDENYKISIDDMSFKIPEKENW